MDRLNALSVISIAVALIYIGTSMVGSGYAGNTGEYSSECPESSLDVNGDLLNIYDTATNQQLQGPIFTLDSIVYKDGKLQNAQVVNGGCYLELTGEPYSGSLVFTVSYSRSSSESGSQAVEFQIGLSTSSVNSNVRYVDLPVVGSVIEMPITNSSGVAVSAAINTPYYLFLKVKSTVTPSAINNPQDITLTFNAMTDARGSTYISGNNVVAKVVVGDYVKVPVVTDPETGEEKPTSSAIVDSLPNLVDGCPAANIWYDDTEKSVVPSGVNTSSTFDLEINDGTYFAIKYHLFNSANKDVNLSFTVTYDIYNSSGVKTGSKTLTYDVTRSGTSEVLGILGYSGSGNALTDYSSIDALGTHWIGGENLRNIDLVITGNVPRPAEVKNASVTATILLKPGTLD